MPFNPHTPKDVSDMLAAIRVAEEFKLKVVLLGAAEGWMIADELARKHVPVVVKPLTNIPSFEALSASLENAARLERAGVTLALSSFDTHNARNLRQEAGNAISYGLDRDAALRAVTLRAPSLDRKYRRLPLAVAVAVAVAVALWNPAPVTFSPRHASSTADRTLARASRSTFCVAAANERSVA